MELATRKILHVKPVFSSSPQRSFCCFIFTTGWSDGGFVINGLSSTNINYNKSDNAIHDLPFACVVISPWLHLQQIQCKASPNVSTATPSRGTPWYRKSYCVNGAIGLSINNVTGRCKMKCAISINKITYVIKGATSVTNAAFGFYAERPVRKIRDSLPHQSPTTGGSDGSRCLSQGKKISWKQLLATVWGPLTKMMLNRNVDDYTKTQNRRKIHWKTEKTTWWKPKEY